VIIGRRRGRGTDGQEGPDGQAAEALGGAGTDAAIGMIVVQLLANSVLQQVVQKEPEAEQASGAPGPEPSPA
jgi:hypothetical protein